MTATSHALEYAPVSPPKSSRNHAPLLERQLQGGPARRQHLQVTATLEKRIDEASRRKYLLEVVQDQERSIVAEYALERGSQILANRVVSDAHRRRNRPSHLPVSRAADRSTNHTPSRNSLAMTSPVICARVAS